MLHIVLDKIHGMDIGVLIERLQSWALWVLLLIIIRDCIHLLN